MGPLEESMLKDNAPLSLCQVLEEEYIRLHGPLPESYRMAKEGIEKDPTKAPEQIQEEVVRELYRCIHALPEKRAALCISGGGIRSATFGLGIIHGLARLGVLDKF